MTWRGCALTCLLAAGALAGVPPGGRAQPDADEYAVKAAYVRHFGSYVTWPDGFAPAGAETFVLGVLGKDPFGADVLARLAQLSVGNKKVLVRHYPTLADYKPCHVLFLAGEAAGKEGDLTPEQRLAALRQKVNGAPTLLVADREGLAHKGVMINFYLEAGRAKFEINPAAARAAGLAISAKLLKLGRIVTPDKE